MRSIRFCGLLFGWLCGLLPGGLAASDVLAGASAAAGPAQLAIVTTTEYADGVIETREGTGFVVERRYVTVYHNIASQPGRELRSRRIELNGAVVQPAIVDTLNDIAIFKLPAALCQRWCQPAAPELSLDAPTRTQRVAWFVAAEHGGQTRRQADVVEVIYRHHAAEGHRTACDSGVVVAVDEPFVPGSSGGPVVDATSGAVLGMVQGSFVRGSGAQIGYYVPVHCLLSLLTGRVAPLQLFDGSW